MTVIDFTGDFSTELKAIETLKNAVDTQISGMEKAFNELESCWQDHKSGTFLAEQKQKMQDLKTANETAKMEADTYLEKIKSLLNNVYQN